jgi:hypothetical protein
MIMAIPAKHRWIIYALALALTLMAVRWAGGQDSSEQRPAAQAPRPERTVRDTPREAANAETVPEVRLDRLLKRAAPSPGGDPFQAQSWQPPEQAIRRHVPRPRPEAPALPFAYLGKLVDQATTTVFLAKQDRNYIVRAGDTIEGTYLVEKVGDDALVLVYLPLKARQTLPFVARTPAPASPRPQKPMLDDDEDDE